MAAFASPDAPDWKDASAYEALLELERAGFGWEWLRRQAEYRQEALEAITGGSVRRGAEDDRAHAWRLHRFEDPHLAAPAARPIWAAPGYPWVVTAIAECSLRDRDSFELEQLAGFAKSIVSSGAQRLLLSDGYRSIRLDVMGAPLANSPVRLSFQLTGLRDLDRPLLVLRRLRSLMIDGRFAASLYPPIGRARRLVTLLRAFDGLQAGASQADIAAVLLSKNFERHCWRRDAPSLRSRAQRLVKLARKMGDGAFWDLLK